MSVLKGFTSFSSSTPSNDASENIVAFFDYGLIEKSGFVNIQRSNSGVFGGLDYRLRLSRDPRYTDGQVWQGFRKNWVWESGLGALTNTDQTYPGVSGVYVNSTFYPSSTTGTYSHYIDHRNGTVIFNTAIATTSTVECDYSYKYVNVMKANGMPWFLQIHKDSERSDNSNFTSGSGEWGFLPEAKVQLPAIGVEMVNGSEMTPYQLGGGQYIRLNLMAHCVADDSYTRDKLVDIVLMQKERSFYMMDLDSVCNNEKIPLDYRGVPISGALIYPDLVSSYQGRILRFKDCVIDSSYSLNSNVHVGTVKITTEMIHFGV